jgi:hypothetical protein
MRRIPTLSVWPDLAIEALLRLGGTPKSTVESSWSLPPSLSARVKVRWPRTYQWHFTHQWGDQILDMLQRRVDVAIVDLPQVYKGTVVSEFEIDDQRHTVAFNMSDYPDFVDADCVRRSLVTFKFQYRATGYSERRIVPGGYLPVSKSLYRMLRYLRWSKDHLPPEFDVYGRFSMDFSPGIRGEALRRVAGAGTFRFFGGRDLVRSSRYLREVARSQVCIDLPGRGPICFRLVDYLAVGASIVAHPHDVIFPGSLVDGLHIAYCQPDEIVDRCEELLRDRDRQREMSMAARNYFDRYLHRDQLSAYYISSVLAAAGVT